MKDKRNLSKFTAVASLLLASSMALSGCSSFGGRANTDAGADPSSYEDRIKRHAYAGLGIGLSRMQPNTELAPGFNVNDEVEGAGQVTIGIDLSRELSIEAHSADLGSAGFSPEGRVDYHIHGASALLYAGKNRHNFKRRGFSGFGRIGVGLLDNSPVGNVTIKQDNQTHLLFGAGLEYVTSIGLGLRAEAIAFEEDARYMQLGLVYRTGKRNKQKAVEIVKAPEPEPTPLPIPVPAVVVAEPVVEPAPIDTCNEFTGSLEGVNFVTNSADLTGEAKSVLDSVASRLSECDTIPVHISAHTDSVGSKNYNQSLSERRADSVASYLRGSGINTERLTVEAFGESQPIDSNATAEGRKRNRRVELITVQ